MYTQEGTCDFDNLEERERERERCGGECRVQIPRGGRERLTLERLQGKCSRTGDHSYNKKKKMMGFTAFHSKPSC